MPDLSKAYLLTDAGWGIIDLFENGYLILTHVVPFINGTYLPGSWRIVFTLPFHISGAYPSVSNLVILLPMKIEAEMEN